MVKPIKAIRQKEKAVAQNLSRKKEGVYQRFPLLFTLLGTFGVVAVFYGFEGIINRIDLFVNNPIILLIFGLGLLVITGTLYKKLD
ncbi:MAG TPA: hypothetical protein VM124_03745 [Candidatus Limnocylindrales bacterium]|nr:hypothetical protein [Candidatus Limnocylindrales bacterium]